MEEQTHLVSIDIAGRIYKFPLTPEQESKMRSASELIMSKFEDFKRRYKYADDQDFLANTALQLALRIVSDDRDASDRELASALGEFNDQLEEYISNYIEK